MRIAHAQVEAQIAEACAALSGGDITPLGGLFVARAQPGNRPLILREAEAYQFRWFKLDSAHLSLTRRTKQDPQFTALDNSVYTETFRAVRPQ